MAEREPGFYWVKYRDVHAEYEDWHIAKWIGTGWQTVYLLTGLPSNNVSFSEIGERVEPQPETIHAALRATLLKAQAALNPLSGFLRRRTPKMERYLESVREEIRAALSTEEIARPARGGCVVSAPLHDSDRTECDEIEVTPEMVEAGMLEYSSRWLGLCDADDDIAREMLTAAYKSMYRLMPRSEPQPITDAQKTGEEFLLWDPKWKSWDKGHWSAAHWIGKGVWVFPESYAEENEITHYLPLPPDVKP